MSRQITLDEVIHLINQILPTESDDFTTYVLEKGMSIDQYEWEYQGKAFNITIMHKQHTLLFVDLNSKDRSFYIDEMFDTYDENLLDRLGNDIRSKYGMTKVNF